MKQFKYSILAIFSVVLLLMSCSIEKRVHMPGYHISWNKTDIPVSKNKKDKIKGRSTEGNSIAQSQTYKVEKSDSDELIYASNNNEITFSKPSYEVLKLQNKVSASSEEKSILNIDCDLIILRNGQEIQAKVLEVGQKEVKYKNCDNQYGPTFTKSNSDIFMIKYPNGTSTVMEEEKSNSSIVSVNVNTNSDQNSANQNSSGKGLTVAVVLWFLLGILGIHRMYLGYVGLGILYLFTGGLCGIGWIVDGLLFLTGGLKPKNGDYID